MIYQGSCHCGAVQFEAEGEPAKTLVECNCSYCSKRGTLLWFVARSDFRWKAGEGKTGIYQFNKHVIDHHFCPQCGCSPFSFGKDPKGNAMAAINMRCVDNVDLAALPRHAYDGRAL